MIRFGELFETLDAPAITAQLYCARYQNAEQVNLRLSCAEDCLRKGNVAGALQHVLFARGAFTTIGLLENEIVKAEAAAPVKTACTAEED